MGDLDGVEVEAERTSHLGLMKAAVASLVYPSYVKDILDFSAKHLELKVARYAHLDWTLSRLFKRHRLV